jgi:flagellin
MSLFLQTNVSSIAAQSSLAAATTTLNKTMNQLSSGYRINSTADDPAGLGIMSSFQVPDSLQQAGSTSGSTSLEAANAAYGGAPYFDLASTLSTIRDVDVASATSTLAQEQVMAQAGASILAQANQQPQLAISLIRGQ